MSSLGLLLLAIVAVCTISGSQGTVCRDTNKYCPQMMTHGACKFDYLSRVQCPRLCGDCKGTVCRNTNKWCPNMNKYGACNFHQLTRQQCPRMCGICKAECDVVSNDERRECGFHGITVKHCESRGCCWGTIADKNKPWCFYPKSQCKPVEPRLRRDCGHGRITKKQCMDKGCCWSPLKKSSNWPWCHHSESDDTGSGDGSN